MKKQTTKDLDSYLALESTVNTLMGPGGCPWDKQQTHESLKKNLLEECYELLEAIDNKDSKNIAEELGDILLQIALHIHLGTNNGEFNKQDVFSHINNKLVRRHPHVFGDNEAETAEEVKQNWENIKQKERCESSRLSGIPANLPALAYSQLVQERASMAGFDWNGLEGPLDKIVEEISEFNEAKTEFEHQWEIGDILFSVVNLGRWINLSAEESLRLTNKRFSRRFEFMENKCKELGLDFISLNMESKEELWKEAKAEVG